MQITKPQNDLNYYVYYRKKASDKMFMLKYIKTLCKNKQVEITQIAYSKTKSENRENLKIDFV